MIDIRGASGIAKEHTLFLLMNMWTKRLIVIAIVFGLFLIMPKSCLATQIEDLDSEITAVSTTSAALTADVPAAFKDIQDETNLSKGALLVGNVITASAGDIISMDISLVPGPVAPAAIQASIITPPGFTLASITAGPSATSALKQVVFSSGTFIVFGVNQNVIQKGVVATAEFTISTSVKKSFNPIILSNPVLSDINGNGLIVSSVSGTVVVQ